MKKVLLFFLLVGLLSSCNTNEDDLDSTKDELIGTWKLVEILLDPGDGSGVFETVVSEKTIKFQEDGIVTSNGSITRPSIDSDMPSRLRYSVTESVIFSEESNNVKFEIIDSFLIITSLCIEPCQSKYMKIN